MATLRLTSSVAIIRHNFPRNELPFTLRYYLEKVEENVRDADTLTESGQLAEPNSNTLKKAADLAFSGLLTTLNRICLTGDISTVQPDSLARLCSTSTHKLCLYSVNLNPQQLAELVKESKGERWKIQHLQISDMIASVESSNLLGKLTAYTPFVIFLEVYVVWHLFEDAFIACLSEQGARCQTIVFSGMEPDIVQQYREKIGRLQLKIGWRRIIDYEDSIALEFR